MRKCQKCGAENQENAKFCMECGYHLDGDSNQITTEGNELVPNSPTSKTNVLERIKSLAESKKKFLIPAIASVTIVVIGSTLYLNYNNDLNKAKHYFEENDKTSLLSLKQTISREDLELFETFLSEEGERILSAFNNNEMKSDEARNQIKKIGEFSTKNASKNVLLEKFEELNDSKEAFNSGLEYKKAEDALQAYDSFKSVISTDTDYEQAQAHIKELKPKIVEAFIEKANKEHESEKYSESLKTINTAIKLDSENAELQELKTKYEEAKAEADKKAEEEAKRKAEEAEAAKQLTSGKVIETTNAEITFVDAKFSTKVEPDDTSGSYLYYTADSDEIFLDLKFKVKNTGKYGLRLEGLVSNVLAQYGDGYTYQTYNCFWGENPGDISNVYSWDELDPLKTTTFHLAVNLPREVADSQESLRVTFKIAGQEQILNFR